MKICKLPRTIQQSKYLKMLDCPKKPIKVVVGPAGSGKTMFAVQTAAQKLYEKECRKLIITRPSIAVDEELGFLPGDIDSKMEPWSRPIFDLLQVYYPYSKIKQMQSEKIIEVVPLGFMRGRTFDDTFLIADEMQNSTNKQMKMLLTRLGENSNMIVTGDIDQSDFYENGLRQLLENLEGYQEQLEFVEYILLGNEDIQRHPAVKEVLDIYSSPSVMSSSTLTK